MAAFERILSGINDIDKALDNIRLGDNVVWQVTKLPEFKIFVEPYVEQAIKDKRNLIYFRFASHEPLLESRKGLKIINIDLSHRFETFTVEIYNLIKSEGKDAFYVFDCLSELQTAWSTDLMMGNFFQLICPFLFSLDTVAYFPLIRGKHSFQAIARIRDTTQLFLDVCSDSSHIYFRPLKVWNRYSETMFLPHIYDKKHNTMNPLMQSIQMSHFYGLLNNLQSYGTEQNTDSWERFFSGAAQNYYQGLDISEACSRMCNIMITRDEKLRTLVKENFKPEDYFQIRSRMIGTGMIGGKACGMLLARKIIENRRPDIYEHIEPHDSYYIGSDVFYSYIVYNKLWDIRIRQRTEKEYFSIAGELAQCLKNGSFSGEEKEQFMRMLDYYGQSPIIVRSSSILEDGFGNAFAGKYESVFCVNQGSMEERLEAFENAVKTVYASTMDASALDYRLRRGLQNRDEQMALLVQRVSGSRYGNFFMPCAAGVGYSYSPYRFLKSIDANAGMLRLVMGLGTAAVDRTEGSYPRLVSLAAPKLASSVTSAEKHQYSQRNIDLLDMASCRLEHRRFSDVKDKLPRYIKNLLLEHDYDAEYMYRERGQSREILFVSCKGIVENEALMKMMKDLMSLIQEEYKYPVDIEFTINISENGEYVINLLQCRPLKTLGENETVQIKLPERIEPENILLDCRRASMGLSKIIKIDYIVFVDPVGYYNMNHNEKSKIAHAVGALNRALRGRGKNMMLFVPGRIGTSSPELGVPVTFADISEFAAVCEIAESSAGYQPELSYGSHIFQDLVEANIIYGAVFDNDSTVAYHPELIKALDNVLAEYYPQGAKLQDIIGLYDVSGEKCILYNDMAGERLLCIM